MRKVGLHIRKYGSLVDLAEKAMRVGVQIVQCFFVRQYTSALVQTTQEEVDQFLALRDQHLDELFVHGSYWINLASLKHTGFAAFEREYAMAERLGFNYIILHPGTAKGAENTQEGIDALAAMLNKITAREGSVKIVLENTAHAGKAVGSDLHDFELLKEKLHQPDSILFCVDTAHAFAYGYDIRTSSGQEQFISLLDQTMGIQNIVLLHLNDTKEKVGSHIDRHSIIGQGNIGLQALKQFVLHPRLKHIPILLELPELPERQEMDLIELVKSWE